MNDKKVVLLGFRLRRCNDLLGLFERDWRAIGWRRLLRRCRNARHSGNRRSNSNILEREH
jgi:hypothetical protein